MIARRGVLAAALAAPAVARAEPRPWRIVCPFPPGATNDTVARVFARGLAPLLGVPVIVENRPGAGGAVGARHVAESRDGRTLLNASAGNLTIAPHLNAVGYDPLRDFAAVAMAGDAYSLLAVHPRVPARTLAELLEHGRRNPGRLTYASAGIGSAGHLRGALLADAGGFDALHVPFPGSAPAINAVVAGEVDLMIDPIGGPQVAAGRLRALATVAEDRWDAFPDVPTAAEQGIGADWPGAGWFGLFAPATQKAAEVEGLNAAANEVVRDPPSAAALRRAGLRPLALSSAALAARVAADHAGCGVAIRRLNIA